MPFSRRAISILLLTLIFSIAAPLSFRAKQTVETSDTLLIVNAQLADGSGDLLREGALRIRGNRIAGVGKLSASPGERTLDARGLVLAPGFIDIHNHSLAGLDSDPLAATQLAQGIATAVQGPDGESPWPIAAWIEARKKSPAALNVAVFAGHATIREQVMGKDFKRNATEAEIEKMAQLTWQAMNEGAIGLSSGLEYEVGSYSNTTELVAMARAAAEHGGFYSTHIRDEADKAFAALLEEMQIAEQARIPVDHSHIKLGTVGVWGKAYDYIRLIEEARKNGVDFLADCYPYQAWHSNIKVIVPDKQYESPRSVEKALADLGGADHLTITSFKPNPSYEGHTVADLAKTNKLSPVVSHRVLFSLLLLTDAQVSGEFRSDPNLVDCWGMVFTATSPVWVANNGTGTSTLYLGDGTPAPSPAAPLIVRIPSPNAGETAAPTGLVFNGSPGFVVSAGAKSGPSVFIFATEDGTIVGWNPTVDLHNGIIAVPNSGSAVYKGLAVGTSGGKPFIYASNFHDGVVEITTPHSTLQKLSLIPLYRSATLRSA